MFKNVLLDGAKHNFVKHARSNIVVHIKELVPPKHSLMAICTPPSVFIRQLQIEEIDVSVSSVSFASDCLRTFLRNVHCQTVEADLELNRVVLSLLRNNRIFMKLQYKLNLCHKKSFL